MATLERIRRRSGLLLIVIGLAMLAFILTDLFSSGDSLLRGEQSVIGEVNDQKIDYREFNEKVDRRMELARMQNPQQAANLTRVAVADQIWQEMLEQELLIDRYRSLGIGMGDEEYIDRLQRNPQLRNQSAFKDQVTGKFSPSLLRDYWSNVRDQAASDPEAARQYAQWIQFEEAVTDNALRDKYQTAVKKGLYMPSQLAEQVYESKNTSRFIQFFGLEYASLSDSAVEVSESEMRDYYQSNQSEFKAEQERDIAFVSFRVEASQQDINKLEQEMNTYLKPEVVTSRGRTDTLPSFYNTPNDSLFAVARSDRRVMGNYTPVEELSAPLDSLLADRDSNYIYGPYRDGNSFKLTKISDVTYMPDSVKARHILISYQGANQGQSQSQRAPQAAQQLADSLFKQFKADTTGFASTAKQISDDPGSGAKGGNLGWFESGRMVQPFNNFAFLNETGDLGLVFSQFGFHIIHIQDQEGRNRAYKLTNIVRNIEASESTRDSVYQAANTFASAAAKAEDFGQIATEMSYSPRPVTEIKPMQEQILGIGENREIVRWTYDEETTVGDVDLFNNNNISYIVVQLTGQREKGTASFEQVKEEVRDAVIKEKKGLQLLEKVNAARPENGDLQTHAQNLGLTVNNETLNFGSSNLKGFGTEPKVIGTACGLGQGQVSSPIIGDRGVYVLKVNTVSPADPLSDYSNERIRVETEMGNLAPVQVFESLKEEAEIKDKRPRFY